MAFNPVQFGDWSTRLRRALGLRGNLGFTLAGPAATPVVVMGSLDQAPFADVPIQWQQRILLGAAAGVYGLATVKNTGQGVAVIDRIQTCNTGTSVYIARISNDTSGVAGLQNPAVIVNPPLSQIGASQILSPPIVCNATTAAAYPAGWVTKAHSLADLYIDAYGPIVLYPNDVTAIFTTAVNTQIWNTVYGRYFQTADQ